MMVFNLVLIDEDTDGNRLVGFAGDRPDGEVIARTEVEELRQIAIQRREQQTGDTSQPFTEALDSLQSMDVVQAYQLSRAFAFYFELINLAETNHRKRRRRAAQLDADAAPQRGSLRGTLRRMREAGTNRGAALQLLQSITITPVFTAHPTEVARRSVMFKRRRISDLLEQLDAIPLAPSQLDALESALLAEITALWQTDDVRSARPTVRDEIRMALDYYEASIFATVPVLYAEVGEAFRAEFPEGSEANENEPGSSPIGW